MERVNNIAKHPVGTDGYVTFVLSNLVILMTLGVFWLRHIRQVYVTAKNSCVPTTHCDYLLVFGMRLKDNQISADFSQRLDRAAMLYQTKMADRIVILGGLTGKNTKTEAACGKAYLVTQKKIPPDAIQLEESSRHTLENLHNVRTALRAHANNFNTVLITNRYHLARSHNIATGLSIPHQLCPAEDRLVLGLKIIPKIAVEAYFIHWYKTGKIWSQLTKNQKSLARIT